MLSIERQNLIAEYAQKNGAVKTEELIKKFDVSAETVRRDLLVLEKQGVLRRVYGGAISCGGTVVNKNRDERMDEFKEQKRELSEYAAEFINDGDIIAIDEGSTAYEFADVIAQKFSKLTVVTHCLDVLDRLKKNPGIEIIICGGTYIRDENTFLGELTVACYEKLHVMKSFIFPGAISLKGGIMSGHNELMRIQKSMMDMSDKVVIMADSSKFEKNALYSLCQMDNSFVYVTDSEIPEGFVQLYEESGYNLIRGKRNE